MDVAEAALGLGDERALAHAGVSGHRDDARTTADDETEPIDEGGELDLAPDELATM